MNRNEEKGITLIALVITIIVLIILAGVSIAMLTGENGILTKAQSASEQTKYKNAEEKVKLAVSGSRDAAGLNYNDLQKNINNIEGIKEQVGEITQSSFPIKVNVDGYDFEIQNSGDVLQDENINWEEILNNATTPHPDQSESNKTIGVGTDGDLVNMDLWFIEKIENGYALRNEIRSSDIRDKSYLGGFIDGQIQGKVPQYIKATGDTQFYPVTDMNQTFVDSYELTIAPKIPNTVVNMYGTFSVTGIINTPIIPDGVNIMTGTFSSCYSLENVSNIPNGVTQMEGTFRGCENLKKGPEIPESVVNMRFTFMDCIKLTGELVINANPTEDFYDCFLNAATDSSANLILKGKSSMLEELKNTATSDSHITVQK